MLNDFRFRCAVMVLVTGVAASSALHAQFIPIDGENLGYTIIFDPTSPDCSTYPPSQSNFQYDATAWVPKKLPNAMGLLSTDVIDSISHKDDVLPPFGQYQSDLNQRNVTIEIEAGPGSQGLSGNVIRQIATATPNEIGRYIFLVRFRTGVLDAPVVYAGPIGSSSSSVVSGLTWDATPTYPVYFTVDQLTRDRLRSYLHLTNLQTSDILMSDGSGHPPTIYRTGAAIGLRAADRITSLSIDADGAIVYSTDLGAGPILPVYGGHVTPGTLVGWVPPDSTYSEGFSLGPHMNEPFIWAPPAVIGLRDVDICNGTRIGDPLHSGACTTTMPVATGTNAPSDERANLLVNGEDGGRNRRVRVPANGTFQLTLNLGNGSAQNLFGLYGGWDVPALSDISTLWIGSSQVQAVRNWPALAAAGSPYSYLIASGWGTTIGSTNFCFNQSITLPPFAHDLTYQAVVLDPQNAGQRTNAIIVDVF